MPLQEHFAEFRKNIVGIEQAFPGPYGEKKIVYADWVASGRLYKPIEEKIASVFGPFVGNTHTETNVTGTSMTRAYHDAQKIIKKHVGASSNEKIITAGFGMTAVINKFQRLLGLSIPEQLADYVDIPVKNRPVVFITHMEHHSNQTSWLETIADVEIVKPDQKGLIDLDNLEDLLKKYKDRRIKIGSFSACSNVTGITTPYHTMAKIMHEHGGLCFVDFAASAPYVKINMNPKKTVEKLDAIFFSPHKFLGGPGTSGVLIFNSKLYERNVPDHPGGGTVDWTNPWGEHKYVNGIEAREDGGTPGFLQSIKSALCVKLKQKMGLKNILEREEQLVRQTFKDLRAIPKIHILANECEHRLGIFSFYVEDIHYNLVTRLLNDRYGIQVRGGCSCAGTYGHYLLHVDPTRSRLITDKINTGDLSEKPGWVRLSLHPTMTDEELDFITSALQEIIANIGKLSRDYEYCPTSNEFYHRSRKKTGCYTQSWFEV